MYLVLNSLVMEGLVCFEAHYFWKWLGNGLGFIAVVLIWGLMVVVVFVLLGN